tara:strand:- start:806 stop:1087 length:282 start_codon:yes stop_codon:yes gene_type:complete
MEHDQLFGGSFNAHKNWKKLRDKHKKWKDSGKKGMPPPEQYHDRGGQAGKGDDARGMSVPKEIYQLNYDLAFGRITEEEHTKRVEAFWENMDK